MIGFSELLITIATNWKDNTNNLLASLEDIIKQKTLELSISFILLL